MNMSFRANRALAAWHNKERPMNDFHRTVMGHQFYEGTMPALVRQLQRLNANLEKGLQQDDPIAPAHAYDTTPEGDQFLRRFIINWMTDRHMEVPAAATPTELLQAIVDQAGRP